MSRKWFIAYTFNPNTPANLSIFNIFILDSR